MARQKYEPTEAEVEAVVGVLFGGSAPWMTRQDVALQARDALIAAHAATDLSPVPPSGEDTIGRVLDEYGLTQDDVDRLRENAIDTVAWGLLDLTSDLADRMPSAEAIDEARQHAESVFPSLASPVQTGRSEAEIKALDLLEQALLWRVNGMGGVPLDEIRAWDVAAEGLLRAVRVAATEGSK